MLLNLLLLVGTCFAQSDIQKEIAFEGFSFKLKEVGSKISISLDGKQGPLKTHSEIVPNPNRFLIDVIGVPSNTARSIDLKGQIVERIRVGIHRDKTRIVIDLRKDLKDLENSSEDKSDPNLAVYKYLFNLSGQADEEATLQNIEPAPTAEPTQAAMEHKSKENLTSTPTLAPTLDRKKEDKPTEVLPTIASKEILAPTMALKTKAELPIPSANEPVDITDDFSTPEASTTQVDPDINEMKREQDPVAPSIEEQASESEPAKIAASPEAIKLHEKEKAVVSDPSPIREIDQAILDIEKSNLIKKNVLKNVVFQTTSDKIQSTLAVSVSELGTYELKQVSDTKYVLELPSTRLRAKHLSLPQYPPDSFKGFIYIKAEETENSSLVIIVVDPGIKLTTEVSQGKLWIKSK